MNLRSLAGLALAVALAASPAAAATGEVSIVSGVAGPEGPLYVRGALYYVAWTGGSLSRWDGHSSVVLNDLAGCGHNGVALTRRDTLLVACSADPGAILELDLNGRLLRRWDTDAKGARLVGGINDVVVAPDGGAYATVFGPYQDVPTAVAGAILYLPPGGDAWTQVAGELNYANGIGVSPDNKTLYVSQTVGNSMLKFAIEPDGRLSHRSNFALLNLLTPDVARSWWLGPDSMKVDRAGDIYVAQWFGGKILKLSPTGKLLHVFPIAAGDGPTNLSFDEGERHLYVSVVRDANDPKAMGGIVRIDNVK